MKQLLLLSPYLFFYGVPIALLAYALPKLIRKRREHNEAQRRLRLELWQRRVR